MSIITDWTELNASSSYAPLSPFRPSIAARAIVPFEYFRFLPHSVVVHIYGSNTFMFFLGWLGEGN